MRQRVFSAWGIQTGPLATFIANIFLLFHLHTGGPFLITPEDQYWENGIVPISKLNETEGFQCLGHSNRTICSPLSLFCSQNFPTFSPLGERNNARTIFQGKEYFTSGRIGRPRNSYPFFRIQFNLNNFDWMYLTHYHEKLSFLINVKNIFDRIQMTIDIKDKSVLS